MKDHHAALEQLHFHLPFQSGIELSVGDRVKLLDEEPLYEIERIDAGKTHSISARRLTDDSAIFVAGSTPQVTAEIGWVSRPASFGFDLPGYDGPLAGSAMDPFEMHEISVGAEIATALSPLWMGATLSDLTAGPLGRWDKAASFQFFMPDAVLAGLPEADILSGQNKFAVETETGWEIIQIAELTLTAPNIYEGRRLLRGLAGSDVDITANIPAGARILYLDQGLSPLPLSPELLEETLTVTPKLAGQEGDSSDFTYVGRHLRPLAPVHIRSYLSGPDRIISWIRRTREGGDSWAGADVPLGETEERYRIGRFEAGLLSETYETSQPQLTLSASLSGELRISQFSGLYGWGAEAKFTLP